MRNDTAQRSYRILLLDPAGRVLRTKYVPAYEEADAVQRTRELMDGRAVELWDGERLVLRLDPPATALA